MQYFQHCTNKTGALTGLLCCQQENCRHFEGKSSVDLIATLYRQFLSLFSPRDRLIATTASVSKTASSCRHALARICSYTLHLILAAWSKPPLQGRWRDSFDAVLAYTARSSYHHWRAVHQRHVELQACLGE